MNLEQVVAHFGTQEKAAEALGVTQGSVSAWRDGIPPLRQYQIQLVTGGVLKADHQQKSAA